MIWFRIIWIFFLAGISGSLTAQHLVEIPVYGNDTVVSLHVDGTVDALNTRKYQHESIFQHVSAGVENNVSFSLENKGATDIINPRIEINGKGMIYSMGDLLSRMRLDNLSTLDDTIKVIWTFLYNNYNHWLVSTEAGTYQIKPVRTFNVYGAGQCENASQLICTILKCLGYEHVYPVVLNDYHTVGLLSVNGRSIILDADLKTFYTKRDNRSLADIESVIWDRELAGRQHHGGFEASELSMDDDIALGYTDLKRTGYVNNYQHWINADTMTLRIRPGEKIVFNYDSSVGDYFSYYHVASTVNADRAIPPNASLGIVSYKPKISTGWLNSMPGFENVESSGSILYSADSSAVASLIIDFQNPYVWTNGKVAISYSKRSNGYLRISARKEYQTEFTVLHEINGTYTGSNIDTIDLFHFIKPNDYPFRGDPMTNLYYIKIEWMCDSYKGITIDSLYFENNFQLNPNSLPRLNLGENTIRIANPYGEPFNGLVYLHAYKVINKISVPPSPVQPIYPGDGGTVKSSQFKFVWALPGGMLSSEMSDFNIQVSEYPDFRNPVSPTFNKLTSQQHEGHIPEWTIPRVGLLNPNTAYYWRVAVRNMQGVWSKWSPVWSFTIDAPGVPLQPVYTTRGDSTVLEWETNAEGRTPEKFYILAGNERGFSYHDSLIIDSTQKNYYTIKNKSKILDYAFYRIVAVDADYSKSGVSDLIAIENRLDYITPALLQSSDSIYLSLIKIEPRDFVGRSGPPDYKPSMICDTLVIQSVSMPDGLVLEGNIIKGKVKHFGDSTIQIIGKTYYSHKDILETINLAINFPPEITGLTRSIARSDTSFFSQIIATDANGDRLIYTSDILPHWLILDSLSGVLSGSPSPEDAGEHTITIQARDNKNGFAETDVTITALVASPYFAIEAVTDSVFHAEQSSVAATILVVDPSYDTQIQYQLRRGPEWLTIDSITGELFGVPPPEDFGKEYPVRVRAVDTSYAYSDYAFSILVSRVNNPPQFLTTPDTTCYYQALYTYQVNAIDVDTTYKDSVVKYILLSSPSWLTMDSRGLLSGVVPDNKGMFKVLIGAIDVFGDTSRQSFTLSVNDKIVLYPNYPNPFKDITNIQFELPEISRVKLEIFDMSGKKVETVTDKVYYAGRNKITWDAHRHASGMYLAVATINRLLQNKEERLIRKILLLR